MGKGKSRKKIKFPHLLGSKWTAVQPVMGWRHFQVHNRQERQGVVFAYLQSVCDESVSLWLNARQLKNRQLWLAGWQTLEDMFPERYPDDEAGAVFEASTAPEDTSPSPDSPTVPRQAPSNSE